MTIYRVATEPSTLYPSRHRVRGILVQADGRSAVLLAGGPMERWHALSPALE